MNRVCAANVAVLSLLFQANCSSDGNMVRDAGVDGDAVADGRDAPADRAADRASTDGSGLDQTTDSRADGDGSPASDASTSDSGSQETGTCLGTCLESFYAQCTKIGQTCTSSVDGGQTNTCYANGVKQQLIVTSPVATATVRKANGDPCYTVMSQSTREQDVLDPAGAMIARIEIISTTQLRVICNGDGSVTEVNLNLPVCAERKAALAQTCAAGACTW